MSTKKDSRPAKPQQNADNSDADVGLSEEALQNLVGYFDVLIQMDIAQKKNDEPSQSNENIWRDDENIRSTSNAN